MSRQREPTAALQTARLPLLQACWHLRIRTLQTLKMVLLCDTWQRRDTLMRVLVSLVYKKAYVC
jgi:hypothetical protein